jgi:hypothetical protein
MIGQILPNNNERCYSNFSPTFREVNTPLITNLPGKPRAVDRTTSPDSLITVGSGQLTIWSVRCGSVRALPASSQTRYIRKIRGPSPVSIEPQTPSPPPPPSTLPRPDPLPKSHCRVVLHLAWSPNRPVPSLAPPSVASYFLR